MALENSAAQVSTVFMLGTTPSPCDSAHKALVRAGQRGDLGVARTVLLEQTHRVGVDILHTQAANALLDLHHVVDAVEVPRIDAADGMDAGNVPATAQGLDHKADAVLGRGCHGLSELVVA